MALNDRMFDIATLSNDERLVLETFGNMYEGYTNLRNSPEGVAVVHYMYNGTDSGFYLLTRPELVAVRTLGGTWTREARKPEIHGPAPYSSEYYQKYLADAGLPHYFCTMGHLAMRADGAESCHLHEVPQQLQQRTPWPMTEDHLHLGLEAQQSQYLFVRDAEPDKSYISLGDFSADRRHALKFRFPAFHAKPGTYTTVIRPGGFINLLLAGSTWSVEQQLELLAVMPHQLEWRTSSRLPVPASFYEEQPTAQRPSSTASAAVADAPSASIAEVSVAPSLLQPPKPNLLTSNPLWDNNLNTPGRYPRKGRSAAVRTNAIQLQLDHRGIVNPRYQVRGPGLYTWLGPHHQDLAWERKLSYTDVVKMRGSNQLGENDDPSIVWWPEYDYVNPPQQPEGEGDFEYLTPNDEDLAHLNFGGAQDNVLPPQPTATDIWNLRQRLRVSGGLDNAQQIKLVWVSAAWINEHGGQSKYTLVTARASAGDPIVLDEDSQETASEIRSGKRTDGGGSGRGSGEDGNGRKNHGDEDDGMDGVQEE